MMMTTQIDTKYIPGIESSAGSSILPVCDKIPALYERQPALLNSTCHPVNRICACAKPYFRRYSGPPALSNQHYRGTTSYLAPFLGRGSRQIRKRRGPEAPLNFVFFFLHPIYQVPRNIFALLVQLPSCRDPDTGSPIPGTARYTSQACTVELLL